MDQEISGSHRVVNKNLPRDVFLYLLTLAALIACSVSFGTMLFQIINIYFPDILNQMPKQYSLESIRFALATLVVSFPVFLWVSWFIKKDIAKLPEKRELKIRKWLMYLTLFVAAFVIIGDLIALINSYLRGEITTSFILKIVSILFIAGSILFYYFSELRERENLKAAIKGLIWLIIIVVIATIVFGFYIAGSPQSQRLVRFDERKVSDLANIQGQVISYWQAKRILPKTLDDLSVNFQVPRDPQNSSSYEYIVDSPQVFELCATFNAQATDPSIGYETVPIDPKGNSTNWSHGIGRQCFKKTIDPSFYPPLTK